MAEHNQSDQDNVVLCEHTGSVAMVTINRPDKHNALNATVLDELESVFDALSEDATTRAVVLTGSGDKAFSAGADLEELTDLDGSAAYRTLSRGQRLFQRIETLAPPVVVAVNGLALGGGFELALAGTVVLAADNAKFGLPEAGLGLMPGYGGTQRLTRAVGKHTAHYLMLSGRTMPARRAYELGVVAEEPVAGTRLQGAATELAQRIARNSPASVTAIRTAVRHGTDSPLQAGLEFESALAGLLTSGADAAEGIAAFQARRNPEFGGDNQLGGGR